MEFQQIDNSYMVYVEKEEKVMDTLTNFCIDHNIHSGQISGIGAVKNIDMGIYDIKAKKYHHKLFDDMHELISFQGNIALKDGKPFVYVCQNYSCKLPTSEIEVVKQQLGLNK